MNLKFFEEYWKRTTLQRPIPYPVRENLMKILNPSKRGIMFSYGNALQVVDVDGIWRTSEFQTIFNSIDKTGGFYKHGWQAQHVLTLLVGCSASFNQLYPIRDISLSFVVDNNYKNACPKSFPSLGGEILPKFCPACHSFTHNNSLSSTSASSTSTLEKSLKWYLAWIDSQEGSQHAKHATPQRSADWMEIDAVHAYNRIVRSSKRASRG